MHLKKLRYSPDRGGKAAAQQLVVNSKFSAGPLTFINLLFFFFNLKCLKIRV